MLTTAIQTLAQVHGVCPPASHRLGGLVRRFWIRRLASAAAGLACAALLSACGGGGGDSQPVLGSPSAPAGLTLSYDVKAFKLTWAAVPAAVGGGTVTYRVMEDVDGPGVGGPVSIASGLTDTHYNREITGLLHTRLNATYSVQACDNVGCGAVTAPVAVNVTEAIGYIKPSNPALSSSFGNSVALSGDGSTLVIGAYGQDNNAGAVYVFIHSNGTWSQQAFLKASNPQGDLSASGGGARFGSSVSLSSDGNTLAVGAYQESSSATGINGDQTNIAYAIYGAVYVFTRVDGAWSQQAYVKASNTGLGDEFGYSVSLSGDGNTLAVGARHELSNATGINGDQTNNAGGEVGAVYVYARNGGSWSHQAYVKPSNAGGWFGSSVTLSGDGNTLAVGAYLERSNATGINGDQTNNASPYAGAAYVFTRDSGIWSQQAYMKASNSEGQDDFGYRVALSSDGNTLAVGAFMEASSATGVNGDQTNNASPQAGAVYVFTRSGGTWSQQAYLKASNTGGADWFGSSVALSGDGNTLAVGASQEASNTTGINGDQANNSSYGTGALYVFTRSGGIWSQQAYVKPRYVVDVNPIVGSTQYYFGMNVALSGDGNTLAAGTYGDSSNAGAVYVY
ncbi:MAG: integrin [Ramlibacter sp.]